MVIAIHEDVIICAYVTTPFDKLRVTGHGELFDSPFALRLSKGRTVRSGQALSNHVLGIFSAYV